MSTTVFILRPRRSCMQDDLMEIYFMPKENISFLIDKKFFLNSYIHALIFAIQSRDSESRLRLEPENKEYKLIYPKLLNFSPELNLI